MGRILLFLIAATICWYLLRGVMARNRHVDSRKPPSGEIPPEKPEPSSVETPAPENVRDARFRDL